MSTDDRPPRLEYVLADILRYGTRLASAIITVGLVIALIGGSAPSQANWIAGGLHIVTAGVVLFIALPVLRVITMLVVFLRERDFLIGAVAALVLIILLLGFSVGALPEFHH